MATQAEKLATSLEVLSGLLQSANNSVIFQSQNFPRVHKERLIQAGFLVEIMKGWLLVTDPTKQAGESALWYASFWNFLVVFLTKRFGKDYCLSAEASLALHTATTIIPKQVTVITKKPSGQLVQLPYQTSLFLYQDAKNLPVERDIKNGLQVMTLPEAICRLSRTFFQEHPVETETALGLIREPGQLLHFLLKRGQTTMAGYLIGAYRHIGRTDTAQQILESMIAAGHKINIENPLTKATAHLSLRTISPHVNRLQVLWFRYRSPIVARFPTAPGLPHDPTAYLSAVEERYLNDAYNSLSIEGYQVSPTLIDCIRQGVWSPAKNSGERDALAAKGYRLAFEAVRSSLQAILAGENAGTVAKKDLAIWYRALFSPAVQAGLVQDYHLAGYRSHQVYIQNSRHVPFPQMALLDSMDMFFELLEQEENPAVRAILGHFFFVHIHPYSDGNGRLGRFLMNVMMASGGYPWTIVPVAKRSIYMSALEQASCEDNIIDFVDFIESLGLE